ncbi:hypothetical protein ACERZ8_15100 [Tateyamaria armeniaca]|uniref:Uncharacterized protein n=1 Tax=Tateyamaria armeniaca TaxID=2518930 RepID=A0ABW8UZR5_9RHOB
MTNADGSRNVRDNKSASPTGSKKTIEEGGVTASFFAFLAMVKPDHAKL